MLAACRTVAITVLVTYHRITMRYMSGVGDFFEYGNTGPATAITLVAAVVIVITIYRIANAAKAAGAEAARAAVGLGPDASEEELKAAQDAEARLVAEERRMAEEEARRQQAEVERQRQVEARRLAEERQKAELEARIQREAEAQRVAEERRMAEEAARIQREAEARRVAEERRMVEEEARIQREAEARRVAEERRMAEEEARVQREAEALKVMQTAAAVKGLLLSAADVGLLRGQGVADPDVVSTLTDDDFTSVGIDVATCRAAFEHVELRCMVEGWGHSALSVAGVTAVCAAQPPLSRNELLVVGAVRARLEAALGVSLALADWKTIEREVLAALAAIGLAPGPELEAGQVAAAVAVTAERKREEVEKARRQAAEAARQEAARQKARREAEAEEARRKAERPCGAGTPGCGGHMGHTNLPSIRLFHGHCSRCCKKWTDYRKTYGN
jgi:hypothetical protein